MRSIVWNHHEVMYEINPKGDTRYRVMPYTYGDYILACARLHTNPSDWIEKRPFENGLFSWLRMLGNEDENN